MKNKKYISSLLSHHFTQWWLSQNKLSLKYFPYDSEDLRKRLECMENSYFSLFLFLFICCIGFVTRENYNQQDQYIFLAFGVVGFAVSLFYFVKHKLLFRNHILLELAFAWRGALSILEDVKTFKGMTQDGDISTVCLKVNEQLIEWAVESLKLKAVGEYHSKRARLLIQKIESVVSVCKKCKLSTYHLHEVWSQANRQL